MADEQILWSGHVRVVLTAEGKKQVRYEADGATVESSFQPSGFFEGKAVDGLIQHLKGQTNG